MGPSRRGQTLHFVVGGYWFVNVVHRSKRHVSRQLCVADSSDPSLALLPPFAPKSLRSGKVRSGRAAVCAVQWPARNGAPLLSAPSPSFRRFTALRSVTSATADTAPALRCARQAAGLASTAARSRQSLRLMPRGGSARPAPVGRPAASVAFAPCGPVRKAGRSRETARLGFVYSAARSPTKLVPLRRLHGRRRFAPAWRLPLCAADRSGVRRSWNTRA